MKVPGLDQQNGPSTRQIYVIAVSAAAQMIDFLDLYLIGFVLAYVAKPWHLTTTQSTIVLLSSGVGATLGSFVCGALSDRVGRRPVFLATIVLFAAGTAALAFTPEGSWGYINAVRFVVGFGTTGIYAANIPLLQEFMPFAAGAWRAALSRRSYPCGSWSVPSWSQWLAIALAGGGCSSSVQSRQCRCSCRLSPSRSRHSGSRTAAATKPLAAARLGCSACPSGRLPRRP